ASMSISILREGRLWGLISCHHATPRAVPFEVRTACDFLGQVLSLELAAKEHTADFSDRMALKLVQSQLLTFMAEAPNFVLGLAQHPDELMGLVAARGVALVIGGNCTLLGRTPEERHVRRLADWLATEVRQEVYHCDCLAAVLPEAGAYTETASGLLAIAISKLHRSFVLWFRPEVIRTVRWGGDPRKPAEPEDGPRPHPRTSFEPWTETVRLRSQPWLPSELDAAAEFRNAIVGIVLRKAEEMAELTEKLERSNTELEAFSYSVSHDLRAPFRHIVGYTELLLEDEPALSDTGRRYARTIIESAQFAGTLVDNLLSFSQMGRASIHPGPLDMNQLVRQVRKDVAAEAAGRRVVWRLHDLPAACADLFMMQLALRNLLSNALKYTRTRDEAVIEIDGTRQGAEVVYFVRDNGIGFDMKYVEKLFGVFQRLHRMEEFEGTGIGLANVRRIVERHGGRAWAEGAVGAGATFYFSLPAAADAGPEPGPGED
ncbi:MAG TPA: ATP-binding protein, partial [Isosphaeraceae bacterium]